MASISKIKQIELLLDKYYEGDTSIAEEQTLREFFNNEEVPEHLLYEKAQFVFYKEESSKSREIIINLPQDDSKLRRLNWFNYAAAAVLFVSIGWFSNVQYDKYQRKQEVKLAYEQTQKAMQMLASNFNKGMSGAENLALMNKTQSEIINKKYSK